MGLREPCALQIGQFCEHLGLENVWNKKKCLLIFLLFNSSQGAVWAGRSTCKQHICQKVWWVSTTTSSVKKMLRIRSVGCKCNMMIGSIWKCFSLNLIFIDLILFVSFLDYSFWFVLITIYIIINIYHVYVCVCYKRVLILKCDQHRPFITLFCSGWHNMTWV